MPSGVKHNATTSPESDNDQPYRDGKSGSTLLYDPAGSSKSAGVVGLQTALSLAEAGFDVTIVARDWPGDGDREPTYTSMRSGAQWRSNPDFADYRQQEWDRQTFLHWLELVQAVRPEKLGIEMKPAVYLWNEYEDEPLTPAASHWWTSFLPSFEVMSKEAIDAEGNFAAGFRYKTFAVCPPIYLQYLQGTCREQGVECREHIVGSPSDVFSLDGLENSIGVINCTGLAAGALVSDTNVFPTKGQTVLVAGQASRIATRRGDGWEALVIPWPGTNQTLLGGCKIPGDWNTVPNDDMTKTILDRCKPIAPELLNAGGEFEVLKVQVGLRPSRRGGPRMEAECYRGKDGSEKFIYHCYGNYSAGYEGSVGIAREVCSHVQSHVKSL
ncbi:hypothetical protein G7Y89_g482 [Cudoniella acicularis]|uniref:FAD dependent oxidoreductase domain-containing protein n=1 Tax=Cudoniella acicularis TaxID=354080 RepID=A0A8H4RXZ9_9HELO|nr:hypothetical protein G7Y89_g482 [Cudoniella acicularis]